MCIYIYMYIYTIFCYTPMDDAHNSDVPESDPWFIYNPCIIERYKV